MIKKRPARPQPKRAPASSSNTMLYGIGAVLLAGGVAFFALRPTPSKQPLADKSSAAPTSQPEPKPRLIEELKPGPERPREDATPAPTPTPVAKPSARDRLLDDMARKQAEKLTADAYDQIHLGNMQRGLDLFREANELLPNSAPVEVADNTNDLWKKRVRVNGGEQTLESIYARHQNVLEVKAARRNNP
jgi:hypothetical protein